MWSSKVADFKGVSVAQQVVQDPAEHRHAEVLKGERRTMPELPDQKRLGRLLLG